MKRTTMMKNGFSPGLRLFQTLLALLMTLAVAVPAVFGAITLPPDAEYSQTRLAPGSQTPWQNVVPNALADYFTFVPYTTADAVKLGFPGTCGVVGPGGEDCYTITVKSFAQSLALPAGWGFGGPGLVSDLGAPTTTTVYGYGSGGQLWTPPQFVANPVTGAIGPVAVPVTVTGNSPAIFAAPAALVPPIPGTGIWHFPAPSIKGTKGRPIRVQWLNELPNTVMPGLDPTVDCSASSPNCFPYNRIVTHVHGAHVGPASDGLTQAEYNPNFSLLGVKFSQSVLPPSAGPPATYVYPMDQPAATIWYHDHAAGNTHLNTNMGMAGFFPVTDDNEKCLQGIAHPTLCPAPTKVLPTGNFELGFALQDRVFYPNGQLAMPDAPVIDGNFPSCDPTSAGSRLATCSPLFMYVNHPADPASLTPAGTHLVPYDEATITDFGPGGINANAPVLATSATLEFFGNMPVVNGVVYGKYDVEPRVYRMRFLGGTDSRTWSLQLQHYNALGVSVGIIPFWQIGSEQGFLNTPVQRTEMLLMPGERVDVLVDLKAIPAGDRIMLNNLGTDAPYQGELLTPFNRSLDIPEIMQFNVIALNTTKVLGTVVPPVADVPSPTAAIALQRAGVPLAAAPITPLTATAGLPIRNIALEEIVDQYQRIMPTIDRRGYDLGAPASEIVRVNDTEIWDIINTTADAHPMHLHQVAFQVVHRQPWTSFTPAVNDFVNNVFSQPNYTVDPLLGPAVAPAPHDAGWKDTVYAPPGFVTRVIAKFDLLGEYVWHCHILSHEEHDMMRPLKVVEFPLNKPASLTVPLATPNARTATVTIAPANPANPVPVNYYVEYKQLADSNWTTNLGSGLVQNIIFPRDGVYELRVKAVDTALSPTYAVSDYTVGSNTIVVAPSDSITAPVNNSTLASSTQTFTFTTSGAFAHYLWVGTTAGASDLGNYSVAAGVASITATGLPRNGSTVFVRLWVKDTTGLLPVMRYNDYTYTTTLVPAAAPTYTMTTAAAPNGTLAGSQLKNGLVTPLAAGVATVTAGSTVTYTFTPNAGFEVDVISVDGVLTQSTTVAPITSHTLVDVQANHYLNVYFRPIPNTITIGLGANGTVTGGIAGANLVRTGTAFTVNFVPNAGFEVDAISIDGAVTQSTALAPITSHTFTNVVASHYMNVYFRPIPYSIRLGISGAGTVAVSGAPAPVAGVSPAASGSTVTYTFSPTAGNRVYGIVVDGVLTLSTPAAPLTNHTFAGVAANHSINVYFEPVQLHTITTASNNPAFGTISQAVPGPIYQGANVTFNITPTAPHTLLGIVVDGVYIPGARASYSFTNVQVDHYINAYFQ
jgi:spore coat protein A